ncbi:PREDICTED: probable xyloglucan galactosyltransferase GT17 [Theobroma cacao]|uniref:Probable xyloglucan galactosyltransferase GT17 n=1 Tax=Theobroma cacao TaxID=3641 RepID=A0AB32VY49_THECC|nr:PREDICTED: probable xyloglucan galactosyltransferase GT17 [Theobroma cacao]
MFLSKKQPSAAVPWIEKEKYQKSKDVYFKFLLNPHFRYTAFLFVFLSFWFLLQVFWFPPTKTQYATNTVAAVTTTTTSYGVHQNPRTTATLSSPKCNGRVSVYVYNLPAEFNVGLLEDCSHLNVYTNMCPHVANRGLGQPLDNMDLGSSDVNPWFSTHQFIAEMIFHARVENHPCRTRDPAKANLFYVPFYGGLHVSSKFREQNHTMRDALAVRLGDYLQDQPAWREHYGKDHFIALGRTSWDFMRIESGPDFGANCLLNLPPVKNMSVLTVERNPWQGSNQHGIPYPSYFHPSTSDQMLTWQRMMRRSNRPYLFSFIGAPRKGVDKAAIRDEMIKQCAESTRCKLQQCNHGNPKCYNPAEILRVMRESQFCLQAPGDSFTRRSTFDSILSGCIPVFFSRHTAYTQYAWFLPEKTSEYSVYIDEQGNGSKRIEEELSKISEEEVERMRATVIDMIPRLTYAHPNASSTDLGFEDAVDVALEALAHHVRTKIQDDNAIAASR